MAVGLTPPPALAPVPGVWLGTATAGIRYSGRPDLALMAFAEGSEVACVFTRNAFRAAPVTIAEAHLGMTRPRFALINAGNANAGNGQRGVRDAMRCCELLAAAAGVAPAAVLPFSTGVIGEPLNLAAFRAGIPAALSALGEDGWLAAAQAMMTTDTVAKGASRRIPCAGGVVTITGIAKGAGMIRPDMATMLAFVATDARVEPTHLAELLAGAVDASFHCISVDGDTSTNDACLLVATGRSGVTVDAGSAESAALSAGLREVCTDLAQAIVRDGEGATKFITIEVRGGIDVAECRRVAFAVAHSPLVKTAFYASDPNWGRILAAVGRAGVEGLALGDVGISLSGVRVVQGGERDGAYTEAAGQAAMARAEITLVIELGRGAAEARIWTTDLSHEYVRINAEYRT
jgi:glutamate N-acetyltransferase/amino-acid N-acetyltransferase